uniref:Uncharacterized protein n=1 Tax=candidate division WOR-3 bacterium TaxID=2052148 RepID=A0A7C3J657_UNCW3
MSEDFLKKISSNRGDEKDNPFSKLFQEKKEKIVPTVEEKKEEGISGIENLGTSSTSKNEDEIFETQRPENENYPLPSKDISKENIFEKKEETVSYDSSFLINTSSSTQDLTFDDLSTEKTSSEKEKIEKVVDMLKKGLVDESIEFIKQNFKK